VEMPLQTPVTGVVLAGGASQRMGYDKAILPIAGEPLVLRVARRLHLALPRVVVVGPEALQAVVSDFPVVPDRVPGQGPLAGLATAFADLDTEWLFVVACDMPFVSPPLVRAMLDIALADPDAQAVVLRTARGLEPLHTVYARSCAPIVEVRLEASNHSVAALVAQLEVREVPPEVAARLDPHGLSSFNANTPGDWERALVLAGEKQDE
jgi:molybdopterin-guanine dinucleotide biosynthesis protein A